MMRKFGIVMLSYPASPRGCCQSLQPFGEVPTDELFELQDVFPIRVYQFLADALLERRRFGDVAVLQVCAEMRAQSFGNDRLEDRPERVRSVEQNLNPFAFRDAGWVMHQGDLRDKRVVHP